MGALTDLPMSMPVLVGWVAWLATGLAIVAWTRRQTRQAGYSRDGEWPVAATPAPRPVSATPRSGVRPPKAVPPPDDVFADLQGLLDPPSSTAERPADEP